MVRNNYTVYVHITPSNKYYVGITSYSVEQRWSKGNGYKDNLYFYNAIKKYGWNNIQHEIVATNLNKNEVEKFEILLITKLESSNKMYGYNIKIGGNSSKHSEETKLKMKLSHADFSGENNPCAKSVLCVNTGEVFSNIKEAGEKYNIFPNSISNCCNKRICSAGKDKSGNKLRWIYYSKISEMSEYIRLFNDELYITLFE